MTGTEHSSKAFGGHQPMSVPRTDRGVPSSVRSVPSPVQVNFGTIRIKKIGDHRGRSFASSSRQGTRRAPARRLHMFRAGAGSPEGRLTLKTLHKRAPREGIEPQDRPVLPVLGVAHRDHGGGSAHLYTVALSARVCGYTPAR